MAKKPKRGIADSILLTLVKSTAISAAEQMAADAAAAA
ncbi:hypothetical protein MEA186_30737 [Mesorhizobium amorphae CCNWGS0123]|uniref:Uncharacterized protein n=1 Tax=Mesorhizobium amorphae CCNWGS0123 TaxID=1082933 RepID=G6YJH0_9HYPH|nr:hypothetical protein MEA186_30737 [Mesorhizobium amorphae CCNWGS0123]